MSAPILNPTQSRRVLSRAGLVLLLVLVILLTIPPDLLVSLARHVVERLPDFATIFLGIFIEAVPFLLLGTLASGVVEVFVPKNLITRYVPRSPGLGALGGGLLGMVFPVCECGVVPFSRRLIRKGLPVHAGVAFLLAAPALNPIAIMSTAAAFGFGLMLLLRAGLTFLIATITGLIFSVEKSPWAILRPTPWATGEGTGLIDEVAEEQAISIRGGFRQVLFIALDEFFEMGRYLVLGAALAAAMQVFIPQPALLAIGRGPLASVVVMMLLAVLLSVCSTVDAFIALGFAGIFSPGAILAFLVFGPMIDIKSIFMYGRVFRFRPVLYLVLLPLLMSLLAGLLVNYYIAGI